MRYDIQQQIEQFNIEKHKRKFWHKCVMLMACIVVFCTAYALILPAITMTEEPNCGMEEHTHGPECYAAAEDETQQSEITEPILVCEVQEHEHTKQCYADMEADLETAAQWEASINNVSLTGIWPNDLVAVAESQLGYTESSDNFIVTDSGVCKGYNRYGAWYGEPYEDWNTLFVYFCMHYSDIPQDVLPYEAECENWITILSESERFFTISEGNPTKGNLVFLNGDVTKVGIICQVNDDTVEVIEGDYSDRVEKNTYLINSSDIIGYGKLCEDTEYVSYDSEPITGPETTSVEFPECTCGNSESVLLSHSDSCEYKDSVKRYAQEKSASELYDSWNELTEDEQSFILEYLSWIATDKLNELKGYLENDAESGNEATASDGAVFMVSGDTLPENAKLSVEMPEYSDEKAYSFFNPNIIGDIGKYKIYDISISSNGEEYQPGNGEKVTVTVALTDISPSDDEYLGIAHLDEETGEMLSNTYVEIIDGTVSFEADGFSPYMFYTISKAIDGGERIWGTNWISLRDSGWFNKWNQAGDISELSTNGDIAVQSEEKTVSNSQQIVSSGGANVNPNNDGVSVSKTLTDTEIENVFDITLTVETTTDISIVREDPDMAVVIVMDISNTMKEDYGDGTKVSAAIENVEEFVQKFKSNNGGISQIGMVAFNTDATQICAMQSVSTESERTAFCNTVRTKVGNIINADGYNSSNTRYTDMEAGLKMAQDMLNGVSNENKYVIFLTDGLPTTYVKSGYSGFVPQSGSGTVNADGVFYDSINSKYCQYGVNYSDKAAMRAEKVAQSLKNSGVTIFSIGIDVDYFYAVHSGIEVPYSSSDFIIDQLARGASGTAYYLNGETYSYAGKPNRGVSTIDNVQSGSYTTWITNSGQMYIGRITQDNNQFKNWMKDDLGSGTYYNASDNAGLLSAFEDIFEKLSQKAQETAASLWVTTDPIPVVNTGGNIEFISFINNGSLVGNSITGSHVENGNDTINYGITSENTITWDLKDSGYTTEVSGNSTKYKYTVVYRVRLTNEADGFVENSINETNGNTLLSYKTVTTTDGVSKFSETKTIDFPVPSAKGYLVELSFTKLSVYSGALQQNSTPLAGVKFKLSHDTERCTVCHGDGTTMNLEECYAISNEDGIVSFENIPSGHIYVLEETDVPDGYWANGDKYTVTAAYGDIAVTVTHVDGTTENWNGTDNCIINYTGYELPKTGSSGTIWGTIAGIMLISGTLIYAYILKRNRERRREGL